jgi:hypothetical protein
MSIGSEPLDKAWVQNLLEPLKPGLENKLILPHQQQQREDWRSTFGQHKTCLTKRKLTLQLMRTSNTTLKAKPEAEELRKGTNNVPCLSTGGQAANDSATSAAPFQKGKPTMKR